jgi:uncharacterized membrane protein YheB (UPF0754 family)
VTPIVVQMVLATASCAAIGWIVNVVAIRLIFGGAPGRPGLLARHADRFAGGLADMVTREFFTLRQLSRQVDPTRVRARLGPRLLAAIDAGLASFVGSLPDAVQRSGITGPGALMVIKEQLLGEVDRLTPLIHGFVTERCEALVDLRRAIVDNLTGDNTSRLTALVKDANAAEVRRIPFYGALFGAIVALVELAVLHTGLAGPWAMLAVGVGVGLAVNWLVILMLFAPRNPIRLGPLVLQGALPKRQQAIARQWAEAVGREMRLAQVVDMMLDRGFAEELRSFLTRHLDGFLRERLRLHLTILDAAGAEVQTVRLIDDVLTRIAADAPGLVADITDSIESQLDIPALVRASLEDMERARFENVLRGFVRRDERYLLWYGGLLGGLLGAVVLTVSILFPGLRA